MDRCYVAQKDEFNNAACICSDKPPSIDAVPCIVQLDGLSGADFASSVISNTSSYLSSSGVFGILALSFGVAVLFKFKG